MKKIIVSMFTLALMVSPAFSATWNAADRVATVGKTIVTKNSLPAKTTFKVVNGVANNANTNLTNVIQISSTDLTYAGDLIANIGESITSVLDKIKSMLSEFEYFYDLEGRFVF